MGESRWIRMALLSVVGVTLSCQAPQGTPGGRYKPPKKERGGLAFVPLHGDAREVHHQLFLDVGDPVADAAHADEFRWRIRRFWRGQRPHRVERLAQAG